MEQEYAAIRMLAASFEHHLKQPLRMRNAAYNITLLNQLKLLSHGIALFLIVTSAGLYMWGWTLPTYSVLLIALLIDLLPTLFVHFQYLNRNKGVTLIINPSTKNLSYQKGHFLYEASFDDIKEIVRTSSYGRGAWYSFGDYRFYKIFFHDGTILILTCLLIPDMENDLVAILKKVEEKKLKVIAFI